MHGSEVGRQVARGDLAVSFVKTRCKVSKIVLKEKKKRTGAGSHRKTDNRMLLLHGRDMLGLT